MPESKFRIDEITLVLIVALIAILVAAHNKSSEPEGMEAKKIAEAIMDGHGISFASNGVVDAGKLAEIKNMGYKDLKKSLETKSDFCVYIEDEKGNIILSKGSSKLNGEGIGCSE